MIAKMLTPEKIFNNKVIELIFSWNVVYFLPVFVRQKTSESLSAEMSYKSINNENKFCSNVQNMAVRLE